MTLALNSLDLVNIVEIVRSNLLLENLLIHLLKNHFDLLQQHQVRIIATLLDPNQPINIQLLQHLNSRNLENSSVESINLITPLLLRLEIMPITLNTKLNNQLSWILLLENQTKLSSNDSVTSRDRLSQILVEIV
ncbi:hypothetical protein MJO29_015585 [Puccinia striiformis f. sp. tritici]|nr:hypothetical protein MJO29_015585 [Puccinia striiformis f. sp. tritici]